VWRLQTRLLAFRWAGSSELGDSVHESALSESST